MVFFAFKKSVSRVIVIGFMFFLLIIAYIVFIIVVVARVLAFAEEFFIVYVRFVGMVGFYMFDVVVVVWNVN